MQGEDIPQQSRSPAVSVGALSGLRVLDFSTLLPGPMATLFLAEAGAEVIKVERPGTGEEMRGYQPLWGADSANFNLLNRGKKSIALDLKDENDRRRLQPLIESCDVLVEQFRPGVMARLGLGYDEVRRVNSRAIYCSISGYGQTGPRRARAGHDLNYIGDAGLLALSLGTADAPVIPPALIADIGGGTYPAVINILLALRHRDLTGEGSYLDIAMSDNLFPFLYWALGQGQATGDWPASGGALVTGGSCRYRLYPTADGRFVAVGAIEDKFWAAFTQAIGLEPELRDDKATPERTGARIARIIRSQPSHHWRQTFEAVDCCCSVVRTLPDAMADEHFAARGVFAAELVNERGETMAALPTPVAKPFRADGETSRAAPRLGEHNDALLGPAPASRAVAREGHSPIARGAIFDPESE